MGALDRMAHVNCGYRGDCDCGLAEARAEFEKIEATIAKQDREILAWWATHKDLGGTRSPYGFPPNPPAFVLSAQKRAKS